ncbi:MAG: OmpA family protein, partial [Ginsengibacter sp.]
MKIIHTLIAIFLFGTLHAQNIIKPSSLGIHYSLTDFETANQIKATSLSNVLKNQLWSKPSQMMSGFGIDYLKGITKHIDFVASLNYTKGVNVYNLPSSNTTDFSLLTLDAVLNLKLFSDKYYVRPYLIAGAGVYDQNGIGLYAPLGAGFQFNIFDAAIVNAQIQYRQPLKNSDNANLFYQIGFATALKKKKVAPKPEPLKETVAPQEQEVNPIFKNIQITIYDEATMQPLQSANIMITTANGEALTATSNAEGKVIFNNVKEGNYTVSGNLNNIDASPINISKENFDTAINQIMVSLLHNDPRFTLQGNAINKSTGNPEGGVEINLLNTSQNTSSTLGINSGNDGNFSLQLEANSDFKISGKKAGFISNIENISTKGLNRSTTLYVKLELGIEDAKGRTIILNKISFETGKSIINTSASEDLDKLVQFLKDNPTTNLQIMGYTDNVGNPQKNKTLSQDRANNVVAYLVKNGIDQNRLSAKGYGPLQPIASNLSAEG